MLVVVDATLLVALATRDARSERVNAWFRRWLDEETELHTPELALYEVASGIIRLAAAKAVPPHRVSEIWEHLQELPLIFHSMSHGTRIVELALSLGRKWSQVNLRRQVIILEETKNGERRALPLAGKLMACCKGLRKCDGWTRSSSSHELTGRNRSPFRSRGRRP